MASHDVFVFAAGAGLATGGGGDHPNAPLIDALRAGRPVFGYEIPDNHDPAMGAFLAACWANIDPQHTGAHRPGVVAPAAIEASLDADPLPGPSLLITPKADLDALGAMIVHASGSAGIDLRRQPGVLARVATIAAQDRSVRGPWRIGATVERDPIAGPLSGLVNDPVVPLLHKITATVEYLAVGGFTGLADVVARSATRRARLEADIAGNGGVRLAGAGRVAVVSTGLPGAFVVGYRHAPIVLAHWPRYPGRGWPEPGPRYTIGRWNHTVTAIDLAELTDRLNQIEAGWGGQIDIIGSPLSAASTIRPAALVEIIESALKPARR